MRVAAFGFAVDRILVDRRYLFQESLVIGSVPRFVKPVLIVERPVVQQRQKQHPPTVPRLPVRTENHCRRKGMINLMEHAHRESDLSQVVDGPNETGAAVGDGNQIGHRLKLRRGGSGRSDQKERITFVQMFCRTRPNADHGFSPFFDPYHLDAKCLHVLDGHQALFDIVEDRQLFRFHPFRFGQTA